MHCFHFYCIFSTFLCAQLTKQKIQLVQKKFILVLVSLLPQCQIAYFWGVLSRITANFGRKNSPAGGKVGVVGSARKKGWGVVGSKIFNKKFTDLYLKLATLLCYQNEQPVTKFDKCTAWGFILKGIAINTYVANFSLP